MAIKHILVPLTGESNAAHVVICALKLAQRLSAHITVTDTAGDPRMFIGVDPTDGIASVEVYRLLEEVQENKRAQARKSFDEAVAITKVAIVDKLPGTGSSAGWFDGRTVRGATVTTLGRLADLVVVNRPGDKGGVSDHEAIEIAVFSERRPVLIVPPGAPEIGQHAAIAWNGSVEAADAVERSLDLLAPGSTLTIIQVGDIRPGGAPAKDLMAYLGWHGLTSELRQVADQPQATGKLILKTAQAAGAGLLIMGAYTHSRLRERLLGGVTNHVLKKAGIPVLLAH